MKTGRNEPCPCGSGKKYKKCCYQTQNAAAVNSAKSADAEPGDSIENRDFVTSLLLNTHRYVLGGKTHIKEYYRIRKMHGEIINAMSKYYYDGKFEQTAKLDYIPQIPTGDTLALLNCEFDLDTRMGAQSFYDMMIYKHAPNMDCITEAFIQSHRYRKAEKIEFLQSMLDSKLGLFEIENIDSNEGYIYLKDVFTGIGHKTIDVALSCRNTPPDYYIYTRIIDYHGISFSTGLNLLIDKTDGFIKDHIKNHKKDYNPNEEFLRFTQLYNRCSKLPDKARAAANTYF